MKKIIGVTPRTNMIFETDIFNVYQNYFDAIIKAGGIPIMLPIAEKEDLEALLDYIDGLLITGGNDVNPSLYNQSVTYSKPANLDEDLNDINLINIALEKKIPILGICKGLQIINVALNGSLYQDILKEYNTIVNHTQNENMPKPSNNSMVYGANFIKGSILYDLFGETYSINSFHHQAIKKLGNGLIATAYSDDGLIEAIEVPNKIIAVQWHPERLIYDNKHFSIFTKFLEMC